MAGAGSGAVTPPFANLPWVTQGPDGQYKLTVPAFQALQTMWTAIQFAGTAQPFANLPANPSLGQQRGLINDASMPLTAFTVGDIATGGGSDVAPVYWDGNFWRLG